MSVRYKDHTLLTGGIAAGDVFPMDELVSGSTYQTRHATAAQIQTWAQAGLASVYAPLLSPALTGIPTAPTAAPGVDTTQIATTAFVNAAIDALTLFDGAYSSLSGIPTNLTNLAGLADPNADRLLFWDDSAGVYTFLTLGTNLSITGTTLNAAGGGSITVREVDASPSVGSVTILEFQQSDGFTLTDQTGGVVRVGISIPGSGSGSVGFSGTTTYDPPSLLNGETDTITVTVTGAAVGDLAVVSFTVDLPNGMYFGTPQIISSNTAEVTLINDSGSTQNIGSGTLKVSTLGTGAGDVVGPGSATDNAIARFDATTGKAIQNSAVTIADTTGNMAGVGTVNTHTIPAVAADSFALLAAAQSLTNKKLGSLTGNGFVKTSGGDGTLSVDTATYLTANQTITLSGHITGSGSTSISTTIGAGVVTNAMLAGSIDLTAKVTGALPIANGGTGQTSAANAINALLPTQTGNSGKFLTTNGTAASWATISGGGDALVANPLSQFAATTSAQLAGVINDETGSGVLVFGTRPTLINPAETTQTLTDGATVNWNTDSGGFATVTLGGNRTLAAPTNMRAGGCYVLIVIQDGTGSRTLAFNSAYKFPGGTDPTLSTAASAVDILTFVSDGTNLYGVCQKAFA